MGRPSHNRKVRDFDPRVVFQLMMILGDRREVAEHLGFHPCTLTVIAQRDARRGQFALLFALDAGRYIYCANRSRRVAGLAEVSAVGL